MIGLNPWDSTTITSNSRPVAALIEIQRSNERESSVSLEPDRPWRRYLEGLKEPAGHFSSSHVRAVERVWGQVSAALGRSVPIPFTQPTPRDAIQMAWYSDRYTVEIDVLPDGKVEWFFRDRETNRLEGTDEEAVTELPPAFFELLRSSING